ncbi:nucleotide-binding protein [Acidisoma cellulosilytica]|uniref:Nucleotide-binding protein n=1 Tax=Acidisoma cellulosilyticum TaxID=2802395 RepID=A0A964E7H6_9PROT|nr:TIR domain-containing protein [Acidisoma cellulosilyticum]MCB8884013.1 nucleotide-binding protein [Acidisoma cellulosilyticum]
MASLKDRFDQDGIVEALLRQRLVRSDRDLAQKIAEAGQTAEYTKGAILIEQGSWENDLHFILAGEFEVLVNGQYKQTRVAGEAVGELAGLNRSRPRTATVIATKESLVLNISLTELNQIVGNDVDFWKATADAVADQLDHRNQEVGAANEYPRIFVISSKEGLPVARQVRQNLDSDEMPVYLWDHGTFAVSEYPISSLEDAIERADFTIAIAKADDILVMRGESSKVPRDNVHFEYGISVGHLGRERSFLLVEADAEIRLASDLAGLTTLRYQGSDKDKMERSVAKACDQARERIEFVGVRRDRKAR